MKLTIEVDIELVNSLYPENIGEISIGRIYYPDEGNKIQIIKGLNIITFSEVIHHEIGHLFDWYLSNGEQDINEDIREEIADKIGEALRFKTYK